MDKTYTDPLTERQKANSPWAQEVTQGSVYRREMTYPAIGQWTPVENEEAIKNARGGIKHDQNKSRLDLIDAEFLEGLGHVLRFGANKYATHNWRGGINYSRLIGAAYRHLGAINRGEDIDGESSMPHIYHLACCVMFLAAMMRHRPDLDDRWRPDDKWQK